MLLVDRPSPERLAAIERELANVPGVASTDAPAAPATTGSSPRTLRAERRRGGRSRETALDAFARADGVTVGGGAVAGLQIGETVGADLGRAELIAFPLLLLLSLLFFRGRATLMPLAVGVTTVLGTFLVLSLVNRVYGLSVFALNLVIGLGLGLAIDYTLFLVTRYREELAAPRRRRRARSRATMATAGRTVAFSAATVAGRADHARRVPAGLPEVDGDRGRDRGASSPRSPRWSSRPRCSRSGAPSWPASGAPTTAEGAAGTGSRTPSCAARGSSRR